MLRAGDGDSGGDRTRAVAPASPPRAPDDGVAQLPLGSPVSGRSRASNTSSNAELNALLGQVRVEASDLVKRVKAGDCPSQLRGDGGGGTSPLKLPTE